MAAPRSPEPDPTMVDHGRQYIWIALGFLAMTSIAVSAAYAGRFGLSFDVLRRDVVRLALLALLGAFLLRGRPWARWAMVALLIAGMWIAFPVFLRDGAWSREGLPGTLPMLAIYTGYFVIARGLIYSASVRAFFRAQRRHPSPAEPTDPPWKT